MSRYAALVLCPVFLAHYKFQVAPAPHPHRRYPSAASDSGSIRIRLKKPRSDTARSFVAAVSASLRRSKSKRKVSKRRSRDDAENRASFDNTAFQPEVVSVPSDPSVSSRVSSSSSNTSQIFENRRASYEHGASLGHISEETGSAFEGDEAEESFASQATATTGPTTPSKTPILQSESPTAMKSKLPVLKYLRRLSPLSSPSKVQKDKENAADVSPSKLPRRAGPAYTSPVRATFAG